VAPEDTPPAEKKGGPADKRYYHLVLVDTFEYDVPVVTEDAPPAENLLDLADLLAEEIWVDIVVDQSDLCVVVRCVLRYGYDLDHLDDYDISKQDKNISQELRVYHWEPILTHGERVYLVSISARASLPSRPVVCVKLFSVSDFLVRHLACPCPSSSSRATVEQ
jgi:hypothetical protein